jgi:hypothetical protein
MASKSRSKARPLELEAASTLRMVEPPGIGAAGRTGAMEGWIQARSAERGASSSSRPEVGGRGRVPTRKFLAHLFRRHCPSVLWFSLGSLPGGGQILPVDPPGSKARRPDEPLVLPALPRIKISRRSLSSSSLWDPELGARDRGRRLQVLRADHG